MKVKEVHFFGIATLWFAITTVASMIIGDAFNFIMAANSTLVMALFMYHISQSHNNGKVLKK